MPLKVQKEMLPQDVAEHTCNPSIQEAETRGWLAQCQPGLPGESEARLGYVVRSCLKKTKTLRKHLQTNHQTNKSEAKQNTQYPKQKPSMISSAHALNLWCVHTPRPGFHHQTKTVCTLSPKLTTLQSCSSTTLVGATERNHHL